MSREEQLRELERDINSFGKVVTVWDISQGEELKRRLVRQGVVWSARFENDRFAFYVSGGEKPLVDDVRSVKEDLDDLVVDGKILRFRFTPLTESDERTLFDFWKEEADIAGTEEELEDAVR